MRRSVWVVAAFLAATAISSGQSAPTSQVEAVPWADNENPRGWFVELTSPPTTEGTTAVLLAAEEAHFHAAAVQAGIHYTESRHFRDLWNGLSVRARAADAEKLRLLPGVAAVYPVMDAVRAQQETEPGHVAEMVTALAMTGADVAQNQLGVTGRHVRVAVIDSGIDYDHPDLGGCFGRGCRVAKGWDFVGDSFNPDPASPAFNPTPSPDPLPDDCDGHGTHVAGIVGANGSIRGVAPESTLYAYRVFGCAGPTTTDVLLAAMENAFADRADIVNMSVAAALQWPQYPSAQAAARLVRKGVIVVAAAGNDGNLGLYAVGAPSTGRGVISVASFDNRAVNLASFTVSPDDRRIGYTKATGAPPPPVSGTTAVTRTGTTESAADACNPLPAGSLSGAIALVRRGTCDFFVKALNAQAAGAAGVLIYNNAAGRVDISVANPTPVTIPVVSITAADGALLDERITAGSVTLTWTSAILSEPQPTANLISAFSSYGPAADLTLKPDLGAPGGSIRSTLPLELGGAGSISGTSMSSPYVAGAIALLLQAHPRMSPAEVLTALQNTARPQLWSGNPTLGALDLVHRQGAGLLTIDRAILATEKVTPGRLALGEFESSTPVARRLHVHAVVRRHRGWHRHGRRWHDDDDCAVVTYTLGHEPAPATLANTFAPALTPAFATVSFDAPTVTAGRGNDEEDAEVVVTIAPPSSAPARLFGGYVTLTPDDDGPTLRVPYLGYNGDYQAIPALTPTGAGFPWLAKRVGTNLVNQPNGASFSLNGTDVPIFLFHLDHQVSRLRIEIFDAATGTPVGFTDNERFVVRNTGTTAFFAFSWTGAASAKPSEPPAPLPNGSYRAVLSVVKALGDPRNPAHVESWTSPTIAIARP